MRPDVSVPGDTPGAQRQLSGVEVDKSRLSAITPFQHGEDGDQVSYEGCGREIPVITKRAVHGRAAEGVVTTPGRAGSDGAVATHDRRFGVLTITRFYLE